MNLPPDCPYVIVRSNYEFPSFVEDRDYQINTINTLAPLPRAGYYLGGGTGKTFCATAAILYKMLEQGLDVAILAMPPILISGWCRWLNMIRPITGAPELKVLEYVGTPKQREAMKLRDYNFILMSMPIFKKDYDDIMAKLQGLKSALLIDEAHSIKSIDSANYKTAKDMVLNGADFLPLTATPMSKPEDAYAFIKLISPDIYRNKNQFENIHVAERDFFEKPIKYQNLELLSQNLAVNSVRLQRRELNKELPPVIFTPLHYALDPAHYKLYKKLVDEQLLEMPDGGKIDATQTNAIQFAMQQIIMNWDHFSGNPDNLAKGFELIEEVFEETNGKLVIIGHYTRTNRKFLEVLKKYNPVAAFGDISPTQQAKNKDRFIDDPNCHIFVIQPQSGGYGLDGLQWVCSDMLFLEMPTVPRDFHQVVWRLDRDGQKEPVNVRIAVAEKTIQVRRLKMMLANDELIGKVQPNVHDLRKALLGE